jgi:hypothetical protein
MQPSPYGNSYEQLLAQVRNHLHDQKVGEGISSLLQNASEKALAAQNVVLSIKERERLFQTVQKEVLTELLKQFDKS